MYQRLMIAIGIIVATLIPTYAQSFDTQAKAVWVYDINTDTVLLEKNADIPFPPASMSKLMTLNMLFEALRDGRVTMDTTFRVSSKARKMGGSKMFLDERDTPTVLDLLHGIIVQSGNDACVVVAEGLAGNEDAFVEVMNQRAKALGMQQSHFANASGWPHPNHQMSMQDLGFLAQRIITQFPEYYPLFSETEYTWKKIRQQNRNPLLSLGIGADGLKTGHTNEAGYGLTGSVQQGNRRIIFVISGLNSQKERAEEAERIVTWAFRQFVEKPLGKAGEYVAHAPVWMGHKKEIALAFEKNTSILVSALQQDNLSSEIVYQGPIEAPISKGTPLAYLHVKRPNLPDSRIALVAQEDIKKGGFLRRIGAATHILWNKFSSDLPSDTAATTQ